MKKLSSDPINSLNIGNYDSSGNKLKRLCDTLLSQERDNTKITDTLFAMFALFKYVTLLKEEDQEMLWKLIQSRLTHSFDPVFPFFIHVKQKTRDFRYP